MMNSAGRPIPFSLFTLLASFVTGGAHAYSDEAIADAEALLKTVSGRAASREASTQDVAVVRYHLLEMKQAAGKLSQEAFCQEAHLQLRAMAAAEGDEETKAGLAARRDKIDAMTASPELCRQANDAIDDYLFGALDVAKSDDDVRQAESDAVEARKRYKAGELDRTTATVAEANALEAPYAAGKITREAYCASGQPAVLADLAAWVENLAQVGQIADADEPVAQVVAPFLRGKGVVDERGVVNVRILGRVLGPALGPEASISSDKVFHEPSL